MFSQIGAKIEVENERTIMAPLEWGFFCNLIEKGLILKGKNFFSRDVARFFCLTQNFYNVKINFNN